MQVSQETELLQNVLKILSFAKYNKEKENKDRTFI